MFEGEGAYKLHIPERIRRQVAIESSYILPATERGVVSCEIPQGQCPYGGEGKRVISNDSPTGEVCICNLDGLVEEASLLDIKKKPKREIDRTKRRDY